MASLSASRSKAFLSVIEKVTLRLGTSALIEPLTTHGSLPRAFWAFLGQPLGQVMPGILMVTRGRLGSTVTLS